MPTFPALSDGWPVGRSVGSAVGVMNVLENVSFFSWSGVYRAATHWFGRMRSSEELRFLLLPLISILIFFVVASVFRIKSTVL